MYICQTKSRPILVAIIITITISLTACQVPDPFIKDQVPTQDVGEEPPTRLLSPTPVPSTPNPTNTPVVEATSETMLVGPAPYPTPDAKPVPWEQLINRELLADLNWDAYRGEVIGNDKNSQWAYSYNYPTGWYADVRSSLIQGFVQNIPMTQGPAQSDFVKFEIMRLTDPPMIEEGRALNPKDLITVTIAGETGIMYSVTQQANQMRQIMVAFQHEGGWLVATGYITLSVADAMALNRYSAIIYEILSSFTFA